MKINKTKFIIFFFVFLVSIGLFADYIDTMQQTYTELQEELLSIDKEAKETTIPHFKHIVVLVMENRSYEEIVNNKSAPYANKLISEYGLATNYYAITHPSLPNYIALLGGSTFGIQKNCMNCFIKKTNLIDQLEKAHITWKAYFESLPNSCFLGSSYPYTRKYNSFVYFTDIIKNQNRCKNIVPYTSLSKDLKSDSTTPDFIWISPNLCHDTHYCKVNSGDTWLAKEVPKILHSPVFQNENSLLIITWDEAEKKSGQNHIPTILIGKAVRKDFKSNKFYNHYSLLHTIESSWNIPPLTPLAKKSSVMYDFFGE